MKSQFEFFSSSFVRSNYRQELKWKAEGKGTEEMWDHMLSRIGLRNRLSQSFRFVTLSFHVTNCMELRKSQFKWCHWNRTNSKRNLTALCCFLAFLAGACERRVTTTFPCCSHYTMNMEMVMCSYGALTTRWLTGWRNEWGHTLNHQETTVSRTGS